MPIRKVAFVFLSLILFSFSAVAQDEQDVIINSSQQWLALLDEGQYQESWEASGALMQQAVSADQWQQAIENVHEQLTMLTGSAVDLTQRELVEVAELEDQANLPEGDYRTLQYRVVHGDYVFAEVVTVQLENGQWKTVGYFVAPEQQ